MYSRTFPLDAKHVSGYSRNECRATTQPSPNQETGYRVDPQFGFTQMLLVVWIKPLRALAHRTSPGEHLLFISIDTGSVRQIAVAGRYQCEITLKEYRHETSQ